MPQIARPQPYRGIPGRYMPKARARSIHAFHNAAFWMAALCPVAVAPIAWLMTGDLALVLAITSATLALSALVACTLVDLMSMRIPNAISILPLVAALLWWGALALGAPVEDGVGYGRSIYAPIAPHIGAGALVPPVFQGALWSQILMAFVAAALVCVPLVLSFIVGAMGGGDVKFIPPFALYLGWSLAFDLLFLTFLFGGFFALAMIIWRKGCRWYTKKRPGLYPELERMAAMRSLAYAPAIAVAGIFCLAAKWEGLLG